MRSLRFAAATTIGACLLVPPAALASTPQMSLRAATSTPEDDVLVAVTGRAPRGAAAVLQSDLGDGWKRIRSVAVGSNGTFRTSYRPLVGTNRIRVVVPATARIDRRVSNTATLAVVPAMTPREPLAHDTVTISGHLPTALARSVRLQFEGSTGWNTVATTKSSTAGVFSFRTRLSASLRFRVEAPKTRIKHVDWSKFVSPVRSVAVKVPTEALEPTVAESLETHPIEPAPSPEPTGQPTPESEPTVVPSPDPSAEPTGDTPGTLRSADPHVAGRMEVGATVTATTEAWGPGDVTLTYQWRRDGQDIAGAGKSTYVLADVDTGTRISVAVTGVRAGYESVTRESAWSAVVTAPVCGPDPPAKADGIPWRCTFADEFDGVSLDRTKWTPQQTAVSGIKSGPGCIVDDDDNVSVVDGTLRLTARREPAPFTCTSPNGDTTTEYTNGSVTSFGRFSQSFGRYEFRAKFPDVQVPGLHGALWLYPVVQSYGAWPRSGEIDVAEVYSRYPDRAIPFVHYRMADPDDRTVTNTACKLNPAEFHTYVLEWTPTTITITYDGAQCIKHTIAPAPPMPAPLPFGRPFAVIMTQVQGRDGTNQFVAGLTPLPATTQIDYVRVWK